MVVVGMRKRFEVCRSRIRSQALLPVEGEQAVHSARKISRVLQSIKRRKCETASRTYGFWVALDAKVIQRFH